MQNKKHLFIYKNGSRGDFLASILLGNILTVSVNNPFILNVGAKRHRYYKTHDINMHAWHWGDEVDIGSYDDYDVVVRIKLETIWDCKQSLKLARIKLSDRNFNSNIDEYLQFEKNFENFTHAMYKVIPFKDLFDINKLKELFFEFRGRSMTPEEEQRIVHNINLNVELLRNN